jgi:D-glycero-D-manno-heptose 1,7-bisphosphate phosphatase
MIIVPNLLLEVPVSKYRFLLFMDRDDTLIADTNYMAGEDIITLNPRIIEILKQVVSEDVAMVIVSNQSGVGRGYFTVEEMILFTNRLYEQLLDEGISILFSAYCTHSPEKGRCSCRKPSGYMPSLILNYFGLVSEQAMFIGNSTIDQESARNSKVTFIHVDKLRLEDLSCLMTRKS